MTNENPSVSWITGTQNAVALARDKNEANRQIANLADAKSELTRLLDDFRVLASGASVARAFGWEGWIPSPKVREDFTEAVTDLDPRPLNRLVTALGSSGRDIKAALIEAWAEQARQRLGDVEELLVLAETLSEVDAVADLSRRLKKALLDLAATQKSVPTARSVQSLTNAETLLTELEASLQPPAVRRFLSSVAHGGASMDLLSEDVTAWLSSHSALGNFKIVARSPKEKSRD